MEDPVLRGVVNNRGSVARARDMPLFHIVMPIKEAVLD